LGCLAAKLLDLVAVGLTRCIPGQALLASLQKLLRPALVQVLVDAFLAAQLGNAGLAAKAFQHDSAIAASGPALDARVEIECIAWVDPGAAWLANQCGDSSGWRWHGVQLQNQRDMCGRMRNYDDPEISTTKQVSATPYKAHYRRHNNTAQAPLEMHAAEDHCL